MKARTLVVLALVAAVAGWRLDLRALLASYLAAWWFITGALLGGCLLFTSTSPRDGAT
ncbi:hypothetical protein ACEN88_33725 [Massilia sp. CT11-108]|uniref:hypothetical protein n=1 Tax=Massilia sp. CT11-108 TaxID=3393900 RepID=UPI0039A4BF44